MRLYVPKHLKLKVIQQYHDYNGNIGVDETHDSIKQNYYWPNMYKELYNYVTRNLQKIKPPLQETDLPPYAIVKVGVYVSGPYPRRYPIISTLLLALLICIVVTQRPTQ